MVHSDLLKFSQDIKDLYLCVRDKEIEDVFIKIATANDEFYFRWIEKNTFDKLPNPRVDGALKVLLTIRKQGISGPEIFKFLMNKGFVSYVPIILKFNELLSDSEVNEILLPFQDIILKISNFEAMAEESGVKESLKILNGLFREALSAEFGKVYDDGSGVERHYVSPRPKKSKKIILKELFVGLFQEYTNKISNALSNVGKEDLAVIVRNGGLVKPEELANAMGRTSINREKLKKAEELFSKIMKNSFLQNKDVVAGFLDEEVSSFIGYISDEECYRAEKERKNQKIKSILGGEDVEYNYITPPKEAIINQAYILIISCFLFIFYTKIEE